MHIWLVKPHVHICPCSRAGLLEHARKFASGPGFRPILGLVTVDSMEVFRHFAFLRHGFKLTTFFIAPKNCIFWGGASLEVIKKFGNFESRKVTRFSWTPLIPFLHPKKMSRVTHNFSESGGKRALAREEVLKIPTINFQFKIYSLRCCVPKPRRLTQLAPLTFSDGGLKWIWCCEISQHTATQCGDALQHKVRWR